MFKFWLRIHDYEEKEYYFSIFIKFRWNNGYFTEINNRFIIILYVLYI